MKLHLPQFSALIVLVLLAASAGGSAVSHSAPPSVVTDRPEIPRPVLPRGMEDGSQSGTHQMEINQKAVNQAPIILAEWDFPIIEGLASPTQTGGEFALGTFTGFYADLSTESGGGIIANGTSWQKSDSAIGIILRFKTPQDFSAVTSITFTIRVDNPPTENPGIQAYVQNGRDEQYAGDYNFFARPPLTDFATFTYKINPHAKGMDIKKITTFRIKVSGPPTSVSGSESGGKYPVLHVRKVVMQ